MRQFNEKVFPRIKCTCRHSFLTRYKGLVHHLPCCVKSQQRRRKRSIVHHIMIFWGNFQINSLCCFLFNWRVCFCGRDGVCVKRRVNSAMSYISIEYYRQCDTSISISVFPVFPVYKVNVVILNYQRWWDLKRFPAVVSPVLYCGWYYLRLEGFDMLMCKK